MRGKNTYFSMVEKSWFALFFLFGNKGLHVYMSPIQAGLAGLTRRDLACYLKSLLKIIYVHIEISHINETEGAGPPSRAE